MSRLDSAKAKVSPATTASIQDPGWSEPCWVSLAALDEVGRDCETGVVAAALAAESPVARSDGKSIASSAETTTKKKKKKDQTNLYKIIRKSLN